MSAQNNTNTLVGGGIYKYWFFDMGQMTIFKTTYNIELDDLEEYVKQKFPSAHYGIHSCGVLTSPVRRIQKVIGGHYVPSPADGVPLTIYPCSVAEKEKAKTDMVENLEKLYGDDKYNDDGTPK